MERVPQSQTPESQRDADAPAADEADHRGAVPKVAACPRAHAGPYRLPATRLHGYLLTIATSIEARKPLSGGPRPAAAFASAASYIFSLFSLFSRRLCLAVPRCSPSAFSFTKYMLPRRGEKTEG